MAATSFSKSGLMSLIQSSKTVARMNKEQRNGFDNFVAQANNAQLIKLFSIFQNEQNFMVELTKKVQKQLVKAFETYENDIKTIVRTIKKQRLVKAEKKTEKREKKVANNLLKQLKNL